VASMSTSTSKKSTSARSPGRFHSAIAALIRVTPTWWPQPRQPVQPRGGQPLLAPGPLGRFGEQGLHAPADLVPHGARSGRRQDGPNRHRLVEILPHRDPPLPQHFAPGDMHSIHPEHPLSEPRISRSSKSAHALEGVSWTP
jgi:hypothetical protein